MQLTDEQKLVLNEGAKIYLIPEQRLGVVHAKREDIQEIQVNIGTTKEPIVIKFSKDEYEKKVYHDDIVARTRVKFTPQGGFGGVKPLTTPPITNKNAMEGLLTKEQVMSDLPTCKAEDVVQSPLDVKYGPQTGSTKVAYINEKTGRFRLTPKEGYVRIEYREVETKEVTLDLTEEQLKVLKDMGIHPKE